jgi:hypothetical protein
MKRMVTVLSIVIGSGRIRDIIPAVILNCIEERLQKQAGNATVFLSDFFDYFCDLKQYLVMI